MLPSCPNCNRRRRARPVRDDRTSGSIGGKANRFPVIDEKRRAIKPSDDITDEEPLLLNPTVGQPETHLAYLVNGEVVGVDEFGAHTVDICHLERGPLRRLRELKIQQTIEAIGLIRDLKKCGDTIRVGKAIEIVERMLLGDDKESAGSARYVMNNAQIFGI